MEIGKGWLGQRAVWRGSLCRSDGRITVGVCAREKKARSKHMEAITSRLNRTKFEVIVFGDECILNHPVEDWPMCDCLVAFYSTGFPSDKAEAYVKLRRPYLLNDLAMQDVLHDRRQIYDLLKDQRVPYPENVYASRDGYGGQAAGELTIVEADDHIQVNNMTIHKPFVEKPVNAEDHNVYIYYPMSAGGGSKRLFRKIGDRSSEFYPDVNEIRREGSFIYESFVETQGTDVKVYTVGPDYGHAEARKSPTLDGKVNRDAEGKEIRFPVILSSEEKEFARKITLAFKQCVCGFDILRVQGCSFVCDVNGWSFVKNSRKYVDDCAMLLQEFIEAAVKPGRRTKVFSTEAPLIKYQAINHTHHLQPRTEEQLQQQQRQQQQQQQMLLNVSQSSSGRYSDNPPRIITSMQHGTGGGGNRLAYLPHSPTSSADSSTTPGSRDFGYGAFAPLGSPASTPPRTPPGDSRSLKHPRKHPEELLAVMAITRHGDRTPKQKMKMKISFPAFLAFYNKYSPGPRKEIKVKGKTHLKEFLGITVKLIDTLRVPQPPSSASKEGGINGLPIPGTNVGGTSDGDPGNRNGHTTRFPKATRDDPMTETTEVDGETYGKLHQIKHVLERWEISGINRKLQLKPREWETYYPADEEGDGRLDGDTKDSSREGGQLPAKSGASDSTGAEATTAVPMGGGGNGQGTGAEKSAENTPPPPGAPPGAPSGAPSGVPKGAKRGAPSSSSGGGNGKGGKGGKKQKGKDKDKDKDKVKDKDKDGEKNGKVEGVVEREGGVQRATHLLLILKWGGELTNLGQRQAIELGNSFRTIMYPDSGTGGLLRLHSTFRHDLKIKTSDEGRVMKTAAAFAKGFLELEGELTPILVSLVSKESSKNSSVMMLDPSGNKDIKKDMERSKDFLHRVMATDVPFTPELIKGVVPTGQASVRRALRSVGNPVAKLKHLRQLVAVLVKQLSRKSAMFPLRTTDRVSAADRELDRGIEADEFATSRVEIAEAREKRHLSDACLSSETGTSRACRDFRLPARGETPLLMLDRWRKLHDELYDNATGFDITKIPDVHDNVRYDGLHNAHLDLDGLPELYDLAKHLADAIVPQEYGITKRGKLTIGSKMCSALLEKIKYDLLIARADNEVDMRYQLDLSHVEDLPINSLGRRVRTRLYFTSESHLHTLLNVLRFPINGHEAVVTDEAKRMLSRTKELCYLTSFVIRLFEDAEKGPEDPARFRVEILFSPGVVKHPLLSGDHLHTAPLVPLHKNLTCKQVEETLDAAIALSSDGANDGDSEAESMLDKLEQVVRQQNKAQQQQQEQEQEQEHEHEQQQTGQQEQQARESHKQDGIEGNGSEQKPERQGEDKSQQDERQRQQQEMEAKEDGSKKGNTDERSRVKSLGGCPADEGRRREDRQQRRERRQQQQQQHRRATSMGERPSHGETREEQDADGRRQQPASRWGAITRGMDGTAGLMAGKGRDDRQHKSNGSAGGHDGERHEDGQERRAQHEGHVGRKGSHHGARRDDGTDDDGAVRNPEDGFARDACKHRGTRRRTGRRRRDAREGGEGRRNGESTEGRGELEADSERRNVGKKGERGMEDESGYSCEDGEHEGDDSDGDDDHHDDDDDDDHHDDGNDGNDDNQDGSDQEGDDDCDDDDDDHHHHSDDEGVESDVGRAVQERLASDSFLSTRCESEFFALDSVSSSTPDDDDDDDDDDDHDHDHRHGQSDSDTNTGRNGIRTGRTRSFTTRRHRTHRRGSNRRSLMAFVGIIGAVTAAAAAALASRRRNI